jgi:tetratricopeptide (TPR) repeat protein
MSDNLARWLYEGAVAVTEGRREDARELLLRVIEADEQNELAWLWLSGAVEDRDDQQVALENVLALNPANAAARSGLANLERAAAGVSRSPSGEWVAPPPWDDNEVVDIACWQCGASVYSIAQFCWQCNAPVRCCNNCAFRLEIRCKQLQDLTNAVVQAARNDCPWWRPPT